MSRAISAITILGLMARRVGERPLAVGAALVVGLEALVTSLGARAPWLSLLALVLAPGLALAPLLPARVRTSPVATLACAPALGLAASFVLLVSLSSAGASLDGTVVRVALAGLVLAGLLLPGPESARPPGRADLRVAGGLLAALALGAVLQQRVIGGDPIPGNDWAKYLLYADQIAAHGGLLIDNPFWMLGVPFREDPSVPALYGSFLSLSGEPASILTHGIWVFAVISILSIFAFTRAFWGDLSAVLAAGLWAVLPISHDILGWHGAPNLAAICLLPVVLVYVTEMAADAMERREIVGVALLLVAVAGTHRLSALVAGMALVVVLAVGAAEGRARGIARDLGWTAIAVAALAPGVAYDLIERGQTFGGTQDYEAYLSTKVSLGPLVGDLTIVFTVLAVIALALAVRWSRRDRALVTLLCLLAVIVALAYSWILEIPLAYFRMAYFLPLVLTPLVAVALTRLLRPLQAALAGAAAALAITALAWSQAGNVRDFYAFTSSASLRGLDAVSATLRPNEVVVTDRCWSFQATWLLHTRTLAALEPEDIQPKAELRPARQAREVLDGTPEGLALARRLGVRYLLVDPTCTDTRSQPIEPPAVGTPVFVSKRLVVLRLPAA
jgi:6-pyruvoyl-tetrahydropterin synthase related domain